MQQPADSRNNNHLAKITEFLGLQRSTVGMLGMVILVGMGERMAERFGGNTVLATAAYNAGPHRVDGWIPVGREVDTLAWIENIPFNETRRYVRRVMAADAIFHWRMTGELRRLSDALPAVVEPASDAGKLASR